MNPTYALDQTFTHTTQTHTFQIHWTKIGNPNSPHPPIIFIHGTPWSNITWHGIASALASTHTIYLYDHPGFGSSPSPKRIQSSSDADSDANAELDDLTDLDGPLTLRATASAALISHWNLNPQTPPHIIAHDNGGLVSLRLLLQHSIKTSSLILIDVVAVPPFGLPFFKLVAENLDVFHAIPPNMTEGLVHSYVKSAAYSALPSDVERELAAPWLQGGSQGVQGFIRELRQGHYRSARGVEERYGEVGGLTDVKVIWGKKDEWIPSETAYKVGETLGAKEVVVVEGAGHLCMFDQPEQVAVEVARWVEATDRERDRGGKE